MKPCEADGPRGNVNRRCTVNGLNQVTQAGAVPLSYDARGNLTGSGGDSYGYSSENLLKSASVGGSGATVTLSYDPLGRLSAVDGETPRRFLYDGLDLIGEYDAAGTIVQRYVHGPGTDDPLIAFQGASMGNPHFLFKDERGSVILETGKYGDPVAIDAYDEYGIPGADNEGRFQYTGQAWIAELGLYHYKARFYSPTLGRFLQTDPIGYGDGMNIYNYVGGDPVNFTDPLGLEGTGPTIVVTARCSIGHQAVSDHREKDGYRCVASPRFNQENLVNRDTSGFGAGAGGPRNAPCSAPPISPAEAAAARRGDRGAFWNSRAARGDPLASTARSILGDSNFSGTFANSRLRGAIFARNRAEGAPLSYSAAQSEVQQIGVQLMRLHVNAINTFGNPSAAQIARYHFDIFRAHRLPNSVFGGAMFTGTETEAAATAHLPGLGWLGC